MGKMDIAYKSNITSIEVMPRQEPSDEVGIHCTWLVYEVMPSFEICVGVC